MRCGALRVEAASAAGVYPARLFIPENCLKRVEEILGPHMALAGVLIAVAIGLIFMFYRIYKSRVRQGVLLAETEALKRSEERLRQMAERDRLTGLYNRNAFMEKVRALVRDEPPQSYVMIYCDIDKFKVVNDLFGHEEGDRLIRYIGECLQTHVGENGVCCRISADYFACCVRNRPALIESLPRTYAEDVKRYNLPFEIVASFGLYVVDDPALPVDGMLDRAALAQKSVKGNYMRRFAFYDETLREAIMDEQEITGMMESALQKEQFILYLQPQYDHLSGALAGAEVLVRWRHPEKGLIPPGAFIPVIEKNGFIIKVDEYVWERTCRLLRAWLDEGREPAPLSVNISRTDLYNPDLFSDIVALVDRYELPHDLLRLEITESAYMENPRQLIEVVSQLREAGFVVEMDDFGSGYSSLNTLKDVPVDVIKLDMKFLSVSDAFGRQVTILKNIVAMVHELGLLVIAEGVETQEQADLLLSFDCRLVQGYYYARPMPVEEFVEKHLGKECPLPLVGRR